VVRDVCRMETEHNPDQELQWTDNMRNYTAAMALLKATMYHHMRSNKKMGKEDPIRWKVGTKSKDWAVYSSKIVAK